MKKQKILLTLTLAIAGMAFFSTNQVFAEGEQVNVGGEDLYVATGTKTNEAGTAIYNASDKTLTLNNYDGGGIEFYSDDELDANIILVGKNIIDENGTAGIIAKNLILSGEGELEIVDKEHYSCTAGVESDFPDSLVVKSGTYDFSHCGPIGATDVRIDGGVFSGNYYGFYGLNITISGGEMNIQDGYLFADKLIIINSGKISMIKNDSDFSDVAICADDEFIVNGGQILITIAGSDIWGIWGETIKFNGGTTKVELMEEPEAGATMTIASRNEVTFGEKVFIEESGVAFGEVHDGADVFYTPTKDDLLVKSITIKEIPEEEDDDDTVKVPDTGVFSADKNGAVAIAVTMVAALISFASYTICYAIKRHSDKVRF